MHIAYMLTSLGRGGAERQVIALAERQVIALAERMAGRGHDWLLRTGNAAMTAAH